MSAVATIIKRRPPRALSIAGPMSGATTANGAMVNARYNATLPRAASALTEKNNEPASAMVMSVSPATPKMCVLARRMNGVTTNASAP